MFSLRRTLAASMAGLAVLAAMPAAAQQADDRPTIAIISFSNGVIGKTQHEELDALRVGIVDLLTGAMAANPRLRVVERERIQAILAEQGLSKSDNIDKATAVRLGKLLGAHHIITGGFIADTKGKMVLTSRSVNAETGIIEYSQNVTGKSEDVLTLIDQAAEKLNSGLKLPPMPRVSMAPAQSQQPATVPASSGSANHESHEMKKDAKLDLKTAVLYSRAISQMDSGNRAQAQESFQAVLTSFPNFAPAKEKLAKLQASSSGE